MVAMSVTNDTTIAIVDSSRLSFASISEAAIE